MHDLEQRERLELATIDYTIRVPVRDLLDLVADEAVAPDGEFSIRDVAPADVWSYVGPAAALTSLKDHGWMFAEGHPGRKWVEEALMQWDDDKFARPIAASLPGAQKLPADRDNRTEAEIVPTSTHETAGTKRQRTQAFLALEQALELDTTDDRELSNVVPIVIGSAREAAKSLSKAEKLELGIALSELRPIIPKIHDDTLVRQIAELITEGMSDATRRLVVLAVLDCNPYWGWVANSGLDMTSELLNELSSHNTEVA
ncbi:MAG: hypothetical protein AAF264_08430 [Pseudomonadota bacterium]